MTAKDRAPSCRQKRTLRPSGRSMEFCLDPPPQAQLSAQPRGGGAAAGVRCARGCRSTRGNARRRDRSCRDDADLGKSGAASLPYRDLGFPAPDSVGCCGSGRQRDASIAIQAAAPITACPEDVRAIAPMRNATLRICASGHRRQILSRSTQAGKPDAFPEQTGKFWQSAMTRDHPIGGSMRARKQLHGRADQFREIADLELVLELRAEVDHSLIADIEFIGDVAVGLAFR